MTPATAAAAAAAAPMTTTTPAAPPMTTSTTTMTMITTTTMTTTTATTSTTTMTTMTTTTTTTTTSETTKTTNVERSACQIKCHSACTGRAPSWFALPRPLCAWPSWQTVGSLAQMSQHSLARRCADLWSSRQQEETNSNSGLSTPPVPCMHMCESVHTAGNHGQHEPAVHQLEHSMQS